MDIEESELENIYGFGAAKHFMPLPNTVVGSHCAWELRLNTVSNRIPGKTQLTWLVIAINQHKIGEIFIFLQYL